jgi:hypothetical protein
MMNGENRQSKFLIEEWSKEMFDKAFRAGRLGKIQALITRRPNRLHSLSNIQASIYNRHSAGLQEVPIDIIRGTESKSSDFDYHFHPLSARSRWRWESIATAYNKNMALPPVELIQVDGEYFVRDGHHRISVARAYGQKTIEAEVTVWKVN